MTGYKVHYNQFLKSRSDIELTRQQVRDLWFLSSTNESPVHRSKSFPPQELPIDSYFCEIWIKQKINHYFQKRSDASWARFIFFICSVITSPPQETFSVVLHVSVPQLLGFSRFLNFFTFPCFVFPIPINGRPVFRPMENFTKLQDFLDLPSNNKHALQNSWDDI